MDLPIRVEMVRSDGRALAEQLAFLLGLAAWLAYTRMYAPLRTVHATLPACPFYLVTGHPCPLCGGTRSFAAMWNGDLLGAARYYPLGPALFGLTLIAAAALVACLLARRRPHVELPGRLESRLYLAAAAVAGVSWTLKLAWLGN